MYVASGVLNRVNGTGHKPEAEHKRATTYKQCKMHSHFCWQCEHLCTLKGGAAACRRCSHCHDKGECSLHCLYVLARLGRRCSLMLDPDNAATPVQSSHAVVLSLLVPSLCRLLSCCSVTCCKESCMMCCMQLVMTPHAKKSGRVRKQSLPLVLYQKTDWHESVPEQQSSTLHTETDHFCTCNIAPDLR